MGAIDWATGGTSTPIARHGWTSVYVADEDGADLPFAACSVAAPEAWLLPAPRAGGTPGTWVVRRMCQTASGGSFFALLGGRFAPNDTATLRIEVHRDPAGHLDPIHLAAIQRGLSDAPLRSGHLRLDRILVHLVDDKPREWAVAARVLGHVCGGLCDDEGLIAIAAQIGIDR